MIPEQELQQMYWDEGMTQKEIGKSFGISNCTVSRTMKIYGIEPRTLSEAKLCGSVKLSKENLEEMYYNNQMTSAEIANKTGISDSTVLRRMKLCGIKIRSNSESQTIDSIKPSKEDLKRMYYNKKMSQIEIANELGVGQSTIFNWMQSYGIKSRVLSEAKMGKYTGENSPSWQGGISFEPYCEKFNNTFKEAVRKRDDYTCQLCGYEQNGQKLSVHHIHYDKSNCWPDVVALCRSCHAKTVRNRDYWEQYFENQLSKRGLTCWSIIQET